ncbi:MAG: helix-turn-helix domain-containing protein [Chitinispirillia bacterium]|nr:helix-turn-helix domain-containing protein [Chitinispirillia bacterium]MCL2269696.1 helix-turn-helix domain-containing protein [Chitinispirillia bacterium]
MDTALTLGGRITYYRKKAGFSQKKCAELADISPTALNYYEKDKREPNVLILVNLAKVLRVTVDTLVGLEPRPDLIAQNSEESFLLRCFRDLNNLGQDRALELVSGLKEMPMYTKPLNNRILDINAFKDHLDALERRFDYLDAALEDNDNKFNDNIFEELTLIHKKLMALTLDGANMEEIRNSIPNAREEYHDKPGACYNRTYELITAYHELIKERADGTVGNDNKPRD